MANNNFGPVFLIPASILLIPLIAMQFTDEVAWGPGDFVIAWVLMTGVGLAYKLATRRAGTPAYRVAMGVALATAFILIWINLAVGVIGSEDNPANLMYAGVLAIGVVGTGIARMEARGMVRVMSVMAGVQALVPVVALLNWKPASTHDLVKVLVLNALFAALFVGSALLFRYAAGERKERTEAAGQPN